MNIKLDVYFKNSVTNESHIFHEDITEEDMKDIIKTRYLDNTPHWLDDNWELDSINVDKIDL